MTMLYPKTLEELICDAEDILKKAKNNLDIIENARNSLTNLSCLSSADIKSLEDKYTEAKECALSQLFEGLTTLKKLK